MSERCGSSSGTPTVRRRSVGWLVAAAALLLLVGGLVALRRSGERAAVAEPDAESVGRLASLPYAAWVSGEPAEGSGVVRDDRARTSPGLNLYSTLAVAGARLFTNAGEVVHSWRGETVDGEGWHLVEPVGDGGILALIKGVRLERYDWEGRRLWAVDGRFHHDLAVDEDGKIYAPIWAEKRLAGRSALPVLETQILVLSPDGIEVERWSTWDLFAADVPPHRLRFAREWLGALAAESVWPPDGRLGMDSPADLMHLNTLEILADDVPGLGRRGDFLICLRETDRIAVVDPAWRTVRWRWGAGTLDRPHQPSLVAGGRILVFDNGRRRRASRVLEVDPSNGAIVWRFPPDASQRIFTASQGGAQRLENGNTLITESERGRAIEVAADGTVVWEFLSPDMRADPGASQWRRASIYRLRRLSPDDLRRWGFDERLRRTRQAD